MVIIIRGCGGQGPAFLQGEEGLSFKGERIVGILRVRGNQEDEEYKA